jgi:hypothetical protein
MASLLLAGVLSIRLSMRALEVMASGARNLGPCYGQTQFRGPLHF